MPSSSMYVEACEESKAKCFNIHNIDDIVRKVKVSAFQNFFRIENQLNIKKVMSKDVYVPCFNIT